MNKNNVSRNLIELRGNKTQRQVADDIGISVSAIVMYEIGERVPKDAIKIKFAKYYGVGVEEIFFADYVTFGDIEPPESEGS